MKASIKLAILGLAVVGGAAQAAVVNSSTADATGSSLVLMLQNSSTGEYLNYELSSTKVFDFNSKAFLQSQPDNKFSTDGDSVTGAMTVASSINGWSNSNLTSYLSSHAGNNITWTVMGAYFNPATGVSSNQDLLFTSTKDHLNAYWDSGQVINASQYFGTNVIKGINDAGTNINTVYGYGSPGGGNLLPGTLGGPEANGAAMGASQSIYLVASAANQAAANTYMSAGLLTLSTAGVLSYVGSDLAGTAPVPVPAALWLLGSGLMGLVGIGRRRNAAVAA